MCPQREITNKRPTNYSRWHRSSLPEWCYLTDGDWFEQRINEGGLQTIAYMETLEVPPLFIESAQQDYKLWPSKEALLREINQKMRIPCFVVRHTSDCNLFSIARFTATGEAEAVIMSEDAYKNLILGLNEGANKVK